MVALRSPVKPTLKAGFTLVELSIVLVIVGLIIGGILVGRDLIKTAQIRKQLKQIQDLETQINTFRGKYGCLPGDCANATDFFGTTDSAGHTVSNGDGNGFIASLGPQAGFNPFSGNCIGPDSTTEVTQLFLHLYLGGLSGFSSDGVTSSYGYGYPPAVIGGGIYVTCLSGGGGTMPTLTVAGQSPRIVIVAGVYYNTVGHQDRIQYQTGMGNYGGTNFGTNGGLTIDTVRIMDQKIDDGIPNTGRFGIISVPGVACLPSSSSYAGAGTSSCNVAAGKLAD